MQSFPDRVRMARIAAGLSQEVLAGQLGINRSSVARWERNDGSKPSMSLFLAIARLTRVDAYWLGFGEGRMAEDHQRKSSVFTSPHLQKEGARVADPEHSTVQYEAGECVAQDGQNETAGKINKNDHLCAKLEQQIRTIATCFRLQQPKAKFSPSEWLVLSSLALQSAQSLKELSGQVRISAAATSKVLRKLTLLGLVEGKPGDRDKHAFCITGKGRSLHALTREGAVRDQSACFSHLSLRELQEITHLLSKCMPGDRHGNATTGPDHK